VTKEGRRSLSLHDSALTEGSGLHCSAPCHLCGLYATAAVGCKTAVMSLVLSWHRCVSVPNE
jgi:hypothetical protein